MKKKAKHKFKTFLLASSIVVTACFCLLITTSIVIYNSYDLNISKLTSTNNGIKVYSANGDETTLYNTNRSICELRTLPDYVLNAFIDTEDKRFYTHNGFDIKRIVKASLKNFTTHSKSEGASTISQQLIKNALLSNEKTYSRKLQEVVLSIKMEKEFSKDEILEMYLNTIYFGNNAYGIQNASQIYFDKDASALTPAEACTLAGIIKSPATYSPKLNYDLCMKRKNLVAQNMLKNKHITNAQYAEIVSTNPTTASNDIDQSYEKEAILEACSLLNMSERDLINKNYEIITFKDDNLQATLRENTNEVLDDLYSVDSISAVANNKGQMLAYFTQSKYDLHNIKRTPASTLKPFAVYLPAISNNILSPATIIKDEPINYSGYSPENANHTYLGYVSARNALASSLNIPAVKVLDCVGLNKSKEMLSHFNINLSNADMNLSLALGNVKGGVKLSTLMNAYLTLSNLGKYHPLSFVKTILDENGNIIYSCDDYAEEIISKEDAFLLTDMLKDTATSGTAKRLQSLYIEVASKTGTAFNGTNNTDVFNFSYTTDYTLMSWIGDIKNENLPNQITSSNQPTEIVKKTLNSLYLDTKPADFVLPENIIKAPFDANEKKDNHIIVAPLSNLDRYIEYDYFKKDNLPESLILSPVELTIDVNNMGAKLSVDSQHLKNAFIMKTTDKGIEKLQFVKDENGYFLLDKDIFGYKSIDYSLMDENGTKLDTKTIKPKDYLINYFDMQLKSNKYRWGI